MMLEPLGNVVTHSYAVQHLAYIIDVEEWPLSFAMWLYRPSCAFKMYMFGLPKENEESRTLEQALEIIDSNTMEYIRTYEKIYPPLEEDE